MPDKNSTSGSPDPIDGSMNVLDSLEQMIAATMEGLQKTISGISGSLGNLQSNIDRLNTATNAGTGNMAGPANAPIDFSDVMDRLTRSITSLDRNIATANSANATPTPPAPMGSNAPLLTANQRAEMERHRDTLDSGRVTTDIPTFATYGGSLQPSPLSTMYRSNDLLGINLGISNRAKPGDYPTHGGSIDIGQDLRSYLGNNSAMLRTLQGSLSKSYEYAQDKGQAGDDYRNAVFARAALPGFYEQQEARGTPIDARTQGLFNVGLNERTMRDASILTASATNSLGRYVGAHQSGAIKYSPFIAMDSTGPDGGGAGATVSTKKFMKSDAAGQYAEGILKTINYVDQLATSSDVKQSAVNDIQTKLNSVRDGVVASMLPKGMQEKLTRMGINLGSMDLSGVDKAQQAAAIASDNLKKLNVQQQTQWLELDDIKREKGDQSPEFQSKAIELNDTRTALQKEERVMMTQEDKYRQGRSNVVNGISNEDLQRMSRSSDPEVRRLEQLMRSQDRLAHGMNVIGGTAPMTTAEKVQGKLDSAAGGASEFAASMMKNLQWSLMFAFSGTVFQALSQIPTQATYETVQPVYSGISNIMGLTPLKNEFMQFGSQAPAIISDLQTRTNSLQALLGSKSASNQAVSSALDIAKAQPIQFGEAMEIMTAMSTYPSTKSQAANPQFQKTMFENVQLLSMLAPEQGTGGALFAIREMLSGQFRSLQMRFNMSPDLLAAYSGTTVGQMKSQSGPEMMNTMNKSLMGMFGGSEILMRRGAESKVQMNNIGDTLTASILNPMVNQVHTGLSQTVNRMMGTVSDGRGGYKDAPSGSLGSIGNMLSVSQQDALKNTALQSTATLMNVRYQNGDNVDRLAERMTILRGGTFEENRSKIQASYDVELQKNTQSLYATPAGAQSLILSGVNTMLGEVLGTFTTSSGMGNMFNSFMTSFSGNIDAYKEESKNLQGSGKEDERRKLAVDFVSDFMKDIQGALASASSTLQASGFGDVIKQVTDTVRIGAQTVFAPIGEAIMAQTVKTAVNLPGLMVGGALASAGQGVVNVGKDVVGGAVNMFNSVTGGEVKGGATNPVGSLLEAGGTASQLMAWGSLRHLSTSPLTAAAKFGGWSLAARGMNQLSQGEGLSGTLALAGATALGVLPSIIPGGMSKWVDSSVRNQASQARVHGPFMLSGTGPEPTPVPSRGPVARAASGIGAFMSSAFAVQSLASSYVDYNDRPMRNVMGPVQQGQPTQIQVSRGRAVWEGLVGNREIGQNARTGLLGSRGFGAIGALAGVAGAVGSYTSYKDTASNKDVSTTEKVFEAMQGVGSLGTMAVPAAAALGLIAGPAAAVALGLSALAMGVGAIGSYVSGSNREKESKTSKDSAERLDSVIRNVITNPVVDAQKQGAKTFDNASDNFGYKNVLTTEEHAKARNTSIQLTSFTERVNKGLAGTVESAYNEYVASDPKKAKQKDEVKQEDLANFKAQIHPVLLSELKGLENQKDVFQEDPNDKSKTTNKLKESYVDEARGRIKEAVKDDKLTESMLKILITALTESKPERDKLQEEKTSQIKALGPQYAEVGMQEYFFGATKLRDMPKDTNLNDQNVTSKADVIKENLGIMHGLQKEGADMIPQLRTSGVGIWGMDPKKVDAFEKSQGALEAQMLEKGLIDPKSMVGAGGMEMMLRVGNAVGFDKVQELGTMNLEKWASGMMQNQGKAVQQMENGDMPSGFSAGVIEQIKLFNNAVDAINADSAVGELGRVSDALNQFLKDVQLSKVLPNSAAADEEKRKKEGLPAPEAPEDKAVRQANEKSATEAKDKEVFDKKVKAYGRTLTSEGDAYDSYGGMKQYDEAFKKRVERNPKLAEKIRNTPMPEIEGVSKPQTAPTEVLKEDEKKEPSFFEKMMSIPGKVMQDFKSQSADREKRKAEKGDKTSGIGQAIESILSPNVAHADSLDATKLGEFYPGYKASIVSPNAGPKGRSVPEAFSPMTSANLDRLANSRTSQMTSANLDRMVAPVGPQMTPANLDRAATGGAVPVTSANLDKQAASVPGGGSFRYTDPSGKTFSGTGDEISEKIGGMPLGGKDFYQKAYGALATAGPRPDYSGSPVGDATNRWNGFDMIPNPKGEGVIERPVFAGIENNVPMSDIFKEAQKNPGMAFETKGGIKMHVPTEEEQVRDWARETLNARAYNSYDKKKGGPGDGPMPVHPVFGIPEVPVEPKLGKGVNPGNNRSNDDGVYLRPIIINTTNTKVVDGGR